MHREIKTRRYAELFAHFVEKYIAAARAARVTRRHTRARIHLVNDRFSNLLARDRLLLPRKTSTLATRRVDHVTCKDKHSFAWLNRFRLRCLQRRWLAYCLEN